VSEAGPRFDSGVTADSPPRVLLVYYSFTQQTARVAETMEAALQEKGYDVSRVGIEFIDPRRSKIFSTFPVRLPALRVATMLIPQRRRLIGEIRVSSAATEGDYDLVVIGSPTWWLTTNMPVRSYLKSPSAQTVMAGKPFAAFSVSRRYWRGNMKDVRRLGEANGASWLAEEHFTAEGGQVKSMLSWLAFMKRGSAREKALGMKMPKPNLKPDFEGQARGFIDRITAR
jgi:flavodoxin